VLIDQIRGNLPGVLAIPAVDIQSGLVHASYAHSRQNDLTAAAPFVAELVFLSQRSTHALDILEMPVDWLLTSVEQLHLLRLLPGGETCLHVAMKCFSTCPAVMGSEIDRCVASPTTM